MTTLYKINGEYVSWSEANRMGYTTSPSNPVSYKSADPQTWGQAEGNGLMQGDLSNPMSGLYFVEGELGWVNIENLSLVQKLYPSTAEDVVMHNTNTGNDSAGVKIESNGDYYYLISGDLSHGWIVEGDLDEFDWEEKGAVTLPTVTPYRKSVQYTGYQINAGDSQFLVDSGTKISYDSSVIYGFRQWVKFSSVQRTPGEIINDGGFIAAKNTGSSAVSGVYTVDYATCSSNQAELVTVLNSSDEAYNAFKFTVDNTDYYYVLDGTQTDWTDDLSSIGYHLRPEIVFGLKWRNGAWSSENFDYNPPDDNYWYMGIVDPTSVSAVGLRSFATDSSPYGYVSSTNAFKFEVIKVYAEIGTNPISGYDVSTFTFTQRGSVMTINNLVKNATSFKSYLCRVTPPEPLVVLLCVRWDSNRWIAPDFVANDWFYTGIRNNDDLAAIQDFGLSTTTAAPNAGTIGNIIYNSNYNYEILALYSDIGQTVSSYTNLSNLSMGPTFYSGGVTLLTIQNVTAINSGLIMSYKLRITNKQS